MRQNFRDFLTQLEQKGELVRIHEEIDIRELSARTAASDKALWFHHVKGYDMGVVSGILGSRQRMAISMECDHRKMGQEFHRRLAQPIPPELVPTGKVKEVIRIGDQIDLTALPVPLVSRLDGGPYITSAIGISKDPELGRNVGCYRFMIRGPKETGIDLIGASDLKLFYDRAFKQGKPLQLAIAIGVHPTLLMGAAHMAASGQDEFELAGALAGEPVRLVKCETVDLEVPADAEIVIEGELLPIGWTEDEGRFGDFTGFVGPIKYNPVFRVTAITHRKDAVFYALHMPDEVDYLIAPPLEGSGWQALSVAGVKATAVYAPAAAGCNLHLYASIRKRPGEGKNALLALMSLKRVKHVVVTDEDVNIFDPNSLERALAYRVRPTQDIIVVDAARGSHLDPSTQLKVTKGALAPLTAKWGVDATIPEGCDPSEYDAIVYPFKQGDDLPTPSVNTPSDVDSLAEAIAQYLTEPHHFYDVMAYFPDIAQRQIVLAWGQLREQNRLDREQATGRYLLKNASSQES
jgi:2,5-furandicarboxylate decarboxylase 1